MRFVFYAVLIFLAFQTCNATMEEKVEEMKSIVRSWGYPIEEHEVETEDGYILKVFRIPHGKEGTDPSKRRPPVILQHGLICSSVSWVIGNPTNAFGYILADEGYDVWLTNSRGNTFSQKHINEKITEEEFYDFSFHEMGYYDTPAVIDYILEKTNETQLYYIGHSQGTTQFWAMASMRPEYNKKIRHMSALAPIALLQKTKGAINIFTKIKGVIEILLKTVGWYSTMNLNNLAEQLQVAGCKMVKHFRLCDNLLFIIGGYDSEEFNTDILPDIMRYTPAGASLKQFLHYGQIALNHGKFTLYDYGKIGNARKYAMSEAPEYDLKQITTPVMLHYGLNDNLAGEEDIYELNRRLPNSKMRKVPHPRFNHLDFMWARDTYELCFRVVIAEMRNH